jgi:hypothetical protein
MSLSLRAQITKIDDGRETALNIQFGITRVAVYDQPAKWYNAVAIVGFGEVPMVLFTNLEVNSHESKAIYKVVEIYLTGWKCEECYRYIKQSYNLEDVKVRNYIAIRNITVIVNAIAYFTCRYLGHSAKLKIMVQKIFILSKIFFGIPTFFNYATADGIAELLNKNNIALQDINYKGKTGISSAAKQLDLYPNWGLSGNSKNLR